MLFSLISLPQGILATRLMRAGTRDMKRMTRVSALVETLSGMVLVLEM